MIIKVPDNFMAGMTGEEMTESVRDMVKTIQARISREKRERLMAAMRVMDGRERQHRRDVQEWTR